MKAFHFQLFIKISGHTQGVGVDFWIIIGKQKLILPLTIKHKSKFKDKMKTKAKVVK